MGRNRKRKMRRQETREEAEGPRRRFIARYMGLKRPVITRARTIVAMKGLRSHQRKNMDRRRRVMKKTKIGAGDFCLSMSAWGVRFYVRIIRVFLCG
jgi:hypothetical protein